MDVGGSKSFSVRLRSEICFAVRCWFSYGLWSYLHESMASHFEAGCRCLVLGYFDCYSCGSSSPSGEPCSGVHPFHPYLQRCVGCCSFQISSVVGLSSSGSLVVLLRSDRFARDSSRQSALSRARKCYFVHSGRRLGFWFEKNSWNYWCAGHGVEAGLRHLIGQESGDAGGDLAQRFCWCNKSHFFHLQPHFGWDQEFPFGSGCIALECWGFLLSGESQGPVQCRESDSGLWYVLGCVGALSDCYLAILSDLLYFHLDLWFGIPFHRREFDLNDRHSFNYGKFLLYYAGF